MSVVQLMTTILDGFSKIHFHVFYTTPKTLASKTTFHPPRCICFEAYCLVRLVNIIVIIVSIVLN